MTPESSAVGFRSSGALVASVSVYAQLESAFAALPAGARLAVAALVSALVNLALEYLRTLAAEYRARRALLDKAPPDAEPSPATERADTLPPDAPRGFAEMGPLWVVTVIAALVSALVECCAPLGLGTPQGRAIPLAVKESGEYGRCASSGYEVDVPPHATVATVASVCVRPYAPLDAGGADAATAATASD